MRSFPAAKSSDWSPELFDVLVFLVENYFDSESCPDPDTLDLKLKAAGFDSDEIEDALQWLAGLSESGETQLPAAFAGRASFRAFVEHEERRLGPGERGLLAFLESADVIDPLQREIIIERALALPDGSLDVARLKLITLIVLWSMGAEPDSLVFDELMSDGDAHALH